MTLPIILASSSKYRAELLRKLGLNFTQQSPDIDESILANEGPQALSARLAKEKAQKIQETAPEAIIIGSDQVPYEPARQDILRKPMTASKNIAQLKACSGQKIEFYTGICLIHPTHPSLSCQVSVDLFTVYFRTLTMNQITQYVENERAYDCAGGFKVEGLGISLFERLEGKDFNSLIGLPLIELITMLSNLGIHPLDRDPG